MPVTIENLIQAVDSVYEIFKQFVRDNTVDVFLMSERDQMVNELIQELHQIVSGNNDSDYTDDSDGPGNLR
jgi:hypothetical protein